MISILYVDDEPQLQGVVKIYLEKNGTFNVETAESAIIALEKLAKTKYDAVVSDYQMPEMDGIEFLKVVRKEYPRLPFIILTGRSREAVAIDALNNGADYYLQKGTDIKALFAELQNMIRKAVEQRHIEESLIASEERYRNVVQTQTEFISRFLPDGTHIFVNDAYCRYFEKTCDEITGYVFKPDIPREDLEQLGKHFSSLTSEKPVATIEHRIVMPNGEVRWQQWNDRAIFNDMGEVLEYQSVGRDITEKVRMEEALRNSEQLNRDIIDHLPDATFAVNKNGEVIVWNHTMENLSEISSSEIIGKGKHKPAMILYGEPRPILTDFVIEKDEDILSNYFKVQYEGNIVIAETPTLNFNNRSIVLWGKASPLYGRNNEIIGAIETVRVLSDK